MTGSVRGIFVDICREISKERYETSHHVRKLKNGNGWLFLCDTGLRYLKKLQFMLTETHQISNLRSPDEILSHLAGKNVAEFSDNFFRFQYATLEMFKRALNNYSLVKLRFFKSTRTLLQCIIKTSPISIMQLIRTLNHIFYHRIAPKIGVEHLYLFYLPQILLLCSLFFL